MLLSPVIRPPRHPLLMARFGLPALLPAEDLARARVPRARGPGAVRRDGRALDAAARRAADVRRSGSSSGCSRTPSAGRVARGGSGPIAAALEAEARSLGVEIVTGHRVDALADLPPARAYLLDVTPRQVLAIAGDRLPARYRRQLEGFRYGPGVFKVDWALDGPIPWTDPATARAGTVHLGGHAARDRRVRGGGRAGAGHADGRSCCSSSRRSRTRRAPRRASTSRGRTATCPTARPST